MSSGAHSRKRDGESHDAGTEFSDKIRAKTGILTIICILKGGGVCERQARWFAT